jgi:hypothetical protein
MLSSPVFIEAHPRSPDSPSNSLKLFPSRAFTLSLTLRPQKPFGCNTYKNTGGTSFKPRVFLPQRGSRLEVLTFRRSGSSSISPIFRTLYQVPYPLTPLVATLTKTPGLWGNSSHSGTLPVSPLCKSPIARHDLGYLLPYASHHSRVTSHFFSRRFHLPLTAGVLEFH